MEEEHLEEAHLCYRPSVNPRWRWLLLGKRSPSAEVPVRRAYPRLRLGHNQESPAPTTSLILMMSSGSLSPGERQERREKPPMRHRSAGPQKAKSGPGTPLASGTCIKLKEMGGPPLGERKLFSATGQIYLLTPASQIV